MFKYILQFYDSTIFLFLCNNDICIQINIQKTKKFVH